MLYGWPTSSSRKPFGVSKRCASGVRNPTNSHLRFIFRRWRKKLSTCFRRHIHNCLHRSPCVAVLKNRFVFKTSTIFRSTKIRLCLRLGSVFKKAKSLTTKDKATPLGTKKAVIRAGRVQYASAIRRFLNRVSQIHLERTSG